MHRSHLSNQAASIVFLKDGTFVVGIEKDKRTSAKAKGAIVCFDPATRKIKWRWEFDAGSIRGAHPINGGILSTAAIWDDLVFYTTSHHPRLGHGYLVALNADTGALVWKHKLRAFAWSSPICVDGVVFAADSTGAAYLLDARTGETKLEGGQEFLELGANVEGSPIVWKRRIYVGLRGGAYVALGE